MGIYSKFILPRIMDWSMNRQVLAKYRQCLLAQVQGEVLELGFGTGLNLPYYPEHIKRITAVDPNPGMNALAAERVKAVPITVETRMLKAETLPMADNTFDTVVSAFALCSIADVRQALNEVHRVLKPGGRFLFLEHGLSPDPKVEAWQHRLAPLSRLLGDGCSPNRNIRRLVGASSLVIERLDNCYLEGTPKISGYLYQGLALKS